jgi:hypothetical protein
MPLSLVLLAEKSDLPNTFAPEGAQRCRALTSGLQGQSAGRKESLSEKVAGLNAAAARKSRKVRVAGAALEGKALKR